MLRHQRNHHISICVLVAASLLAIVQAQTSCLNSGNYTSNSTYQTNLNTLLSNLSPNVDQYGFYNASVGQDPDRINAAVLCRADIQLGVCRSCIESATVDILQACPNRMQAVLWQEFCMLHYSNASFVGTMDTEPISDSWYNVKGLTSPDEFMLDLTFLLDNISTVASHGNSLIKVAYGSTMPTAGFGSEAIYAMVQCSPDLSQQDCYSCLNTASEKLLLVFYGRIGARIFLPSCSLRYETTPFYNETRLHELLSTPMPPPPGSSPTLVAYPSGTGNSDDINTTWTIIIVVSTVAGTIIVILIGCLVWRIYQKKAKEKSEIVRGLDGISINESLQYEFSVIKAATNNFSEANKLGEGGFGAVYKGKLSNCQKIAVKRLSRDSGQGDLEFKNEVMLLAKLQHRNLVRLFGFSIDGQEKLLVYEFVKNASLDQLLFDPTKCSRLNWDRRYKIIGGIARGILYLHEDSRVRIIHRDLKASNVLLDGKMNPKIADFGMARLFVPDETQGNTRRIVGTYSYMAPEYATRGCFSVKSDVYSFGVLLLEIISGQKNDCFCRGETQEDLINSAWENWNNGTTANLVDPVLGAGLSIPRDILRCIHIGLLCVQETPAQRPTMASVVTMLNSCSLSLPVPSSPTSYVYNGRDSEPSMLQDFNSREGNSHNSLKNEGAESVDSALLNEMSISEFDAR